MIFFYRLRGILRGYYYLKRLGNLSILNKIKTEFILTDHKISLKFLFINYDIDNANDLVNQYLSLNLTKVFLSKSSRLQGIVEEILLFFGSKKAVIFPLPKNWISVLKQNQIKTSRILSTLYWYFFVFISYLKGLLFICISLRTFFLKKNYPVKVFLKKVTFDSLNDCQFPDNENEFESHDVFSWLSKFYNSNLKSCLLLHGNKKFKNFVSCKYNVIYSDYIISPIIGFRDFVLFIFWSVYICFYIFFQMCLFNWWYPLMMIEIVRAKRFGLSNSKNYISDEYLFFDEWLYRPLWTYVIEKNYSSKIMFYFYSTNSEGFKTRLGYKDHDFDWRTISWPFYLVWDNFQKEFIRKYAKRNPFFLISGPTYFLSRTINFSTFPKKRFTIVVFDIPPIRISEYCKLGLIHNYYCLDNCINFLNDIVFCCEFLDVNILFKRKRKPNLKFHDNQYLRHCNSLLRDRKLIEIDSSVSPFNLISNSNLSISFPYTSTGIIGKYLKKPSCYYDCTGSLFEDDIGNHDVNLISNKENLIHWLKLSLNIY